MAITPNTTSYRCQVPSLTGAVPSLISWLHFSRISVDIGNLKQLFIGLEFSIYLYLLVHTHKSIHSLSLSLSLSHTHTHSLSLHTRTHTLSLHTRTHTLSLSFGLFIHIFRLKYLFAFQLFPSFQARIIYLLLFIFSFRFPIIHDRGWLWLIV